MVANLTAPELARRLEKEGVAVVSFFAGAAGRCGVLFPPAAGIPAHAAATQQLCALGQPVLTPLLSGAGYESACRAPLNQLNAAVHGLQGLAAGVQVGKSSMAVIGWLVAFAAAAAAPAAAFPTAAATGVCFTCFPRPPPPAPHRWT